MSTKLAVLAVVGGLVVPPVAHAQTGRFCGLTSVKEPMGNLHTAEIEGGPMSAADLDDRDEALASIQLVCTVQVGTQNSNHEGEDKIRMSSLARPAVAVVPPAMISYEVPPGDPVYLCTEAVVDYESRYFDVVANDWSLDPAVACRRAIPVI